MSDANHPQDQDVPGHSDGIRLPEETTTDEEIQLLENALDAIGEDKPVAPSSLASDNDIKLERGRRTVRRERLEDRLLDEEINDVGFKKKCLVATLSLCGLIAGASTAVIATGIVTHTSTL